jgi:hypothetical protein
MIAAAAHIDDEENQGIHHMHGYVRLVDMVYAGAEYDHLRIGMPGLWLESGVEVAAVAEYIDVGE